MSLTTLLLAGEIDLACGRLTLVSAGHFAPLLISEEGAQFVAMGAQPPIGVVELAGPTTISVDVGGAVTLLAFTDGVVERRGEPINVGLERLQREAARAHGPLPQFLDRLTSVLVPDGTDDDVVMLALRWRA